MQSTPQRSDQQLQPEERVTLAKVQPGLRRSERRGPIHDGCGGAIGARVFAVSTSLPRLAIDVVVRTVSPAQMSGSRPDRQVADPPDAPLHMNALVGEACVAVGTDAGVVVFVDRQAHPGRVGPVPTYPVRQLQQGGRTQALALPAQVDPQSADDRCVHLGPLGCRGAASQQQKADDVGAIQDGQTGQVLLVGRCTGGAGLLDRAGVFGLWPAHAKPSHRLLLIVGQRLPAYQAQLRR